MNLTPRLLLKKLLVLPDVHHLELIQPMAGTLEFVLLCFLGIAIVSTALALLHQRSNPALARRFALVITPRLSAWVTLGVLPIMTLIVLLGQLVYGSQFGIFPAIVKISPLAGLGLLALWRYRQCECRIAGTIGVLATLGFALPFVNLLEMLHWPERWPFLNPLVPNIYDVQGVVRALIFLVSAVLATGAALLFRGFVWSESRMAEDAPERALTRIWALSLTVLGAVALPALVVWDSAILPVGAQSFHALAMGAPLLVALWLTALLALALLCEPTKLCGAPLVVLLVFTGLACETTRENFIQSTALADKTALVRMQAEIVSATLTQAPVMIYCGQELGEQAMDCEGFSGVDGRTSIFDYWGVKTIQAWSNAGKFDGSLLTSEQKELRNFYQKLLNITLTEKAITDGLMFDLEYANYDNLKFNSHEQYAYFRKFENELLLIVLNFDDKDLDTEVHFPLEAFQYLGLDENQNFKVHNLLNENEKFPLFNLNSKDLFISRIPAWTGKILKLTKM